MSQTGQPGAPGGQPPAPPPQAPPPPSWQSTPQPPMPPAGGPPPSPAAAQMNALAGQLMDRTPVAGPAGYFYADVPNRAIAFIIDYIIFFIVLAIVGAITIAVMGTNIGFGFGNVASTTSVLVQQVLSYLLIGAYFVYMWTAMRGTVGMRLLGMQIGHESDGRTIDMNQALTRYALMFGPGFAAGLISSFALGLGVIASLVSFVWFIALVVTTAQSPTKQGLHDRYAKTMVVKAARAVG